MDSADLPRSKAAPSPLTDTLRIAALPDETLQRLMSQLADFRPTASGLDDEEVAALAASSGVDQSIAQAALRLAVYLTAEERSAEDIKRVAARVADLSKGQLQTPQVEQVLHTLRSRAGDLATQFEVLEEIESTMPSLVHASVASTLRKISVLRAGSDLRPVAIIRLFLDEGEAIVFQCVPKKLDQLRKVLSEGLAELDELASLTDRNVKP